MLTTPQVKQDVTQTQANDNQREVEKLVNNDVTSDTPHYESINIAKYC